jgi:hypothetical protein
MTTETKRNDFDLEVGNFSEPPPPSVDSDDDVVFYVQRRMGHGRMISNL